MNNQRILTPAFLRFQRRIERPTGIVVPVVAELGLQAKPFKMRVKVSTEWFAFVSEFILQRFGQRGSIRPLDQILRVGVLVAGVGQRAALIGKPRPRQGIGFLRPVFHVLHHNLRILARYYIRKSFSSRTRQQETK